MDLSECIFATASWFENLWNTVIDKEKFSLLADYMYVEMATAQTSRH
jgi:hypothetical protein